MYNNSASINICYTTVYFVKKKKLTIEKSKHRDVSVRYLDQQENQVNLDFKKVKMQHEKRKTHIISLFNTHIPAIQNINESFERVP